MTRTRLTWRCGLAVLATLMLGACSTEESLPQLDVDAAPAAHETRAGTLLAEYAQPRSSRHSGVSVHAQFLDVHGLNYATALEALEVWSPDWQLDVDACSMRSSSPVEHAHADDIRLHLLDVGPITVRGPGEAIRLEARHLPDLLSAFSGVIYGTEQGFGSQPMRIAYQPGGLYSFGAPGSRDNGGFYVTMKAPQPIRIASVGEVDASHGSQLAWDFGRDLKVGWAPTDDTQDQAVFLRISSGFGPDRPRLTCRVDDDGSFTVPASLVQQLAADGSDLQLSLRRVNATKADVDGLETSDFVFSTVDEITLSDTAQSSSSMRRTR